MAFPANIEQWRLIDNYDNYEVSSHGRVRNNKTAKILKLYTSKDGYYKVGLSKNKKKTVIRIHQLVCLAFCDNPDNYNIVEHVDNNKLNNMFNNLRWVYTSSNSRLRTKAKHNTGETHGVTGDKYSWRAKWCDNEGKQKSKSFSVKVYGFEQAKTLAIEWRKARELEFGYL